MKSSTHPTYLLLASLCTAVSLIAAGCSSVRPLTKEELALNRQFSREVAEDRSYVIAPAGFSVRPVKEPFITTYYRRIGDDGILFWLDGEAQRDPKYYAGKLSTYVLGLNLYETDSTALASLQTLISHGTGPMCVDWESVEQTQASARLKARFQQFVNGIQFDL